MRTFCPHSWNICTLRSLRVSVSNLEFSVGYYDVLYVSLVYSEFVLDPAGDISGAVQTLRTLLLFYPSDKDSLDNLQLYSETLGGATEAQATTPNQVTFTSISLCQIILYSPLIMIQAAFLWICLTGYCQLHQSVFAGEETTLFRHGEP